MKYSQSEENQQSSVILSFFQLFFLKITPTGVAFFPSSLPFSFYFLLVGRNKILNVFNNLKIIQCMSLVLFSFQILFVAVEMKRQMKTTDLSIDWQAAPHFK